MREIVSFEFRRRVSGLLIVSGALVLYVALNVGLFPTIEQAGLDFDAYLETLPAEVRRGFIGNVTTLSSIEGYLVAQLYQTGWLLFLGVYFAYAASRLVTGEIEGKSMDVLLSSPITRTEVVVGKFLSLVPMVVLVNVVAYYAVYLGVLFVGEYVALVDLAVLHAVLVVYLLACTALGLVISVVFGSLRRAQGVAIGSVFAMFILDTLTFDTDYEWIGDISFTRYVDPGDLLVAGDIDYDGIAVLVLATIALVMLAAELFERKDIYD